MRIARDEKILKRRVDDYLWYDKSPTVRALRIVLNKHFSDFDNVSIFGGMVRDLARDGKAGFRSDIDLVIDAPAEDVKALSKRMNAKPNIFGGYGFATERWKIDFWALETSWALRAGHITASNNDDLLKGTFFDWDAAMYDIKKRRLSVEDGYCEKLNSRMLGINLIATPSSVANAVRAIKRIISWDLRPSNTLLDFIDKVISMEGIEIVAACERRKYGTSICAKYKSREDLLDSISGLKNEATVGGGSPRQLELSGILHN
ncbi:hypothetical protein FB480_103174 [Agrobacterium vitis]|nr:hypothetical protein FB480_103174 [Agrobacterium vitis]